MEDREGAWVENREGEGTEKERWEGHRRGSVREEDRGRQRAGRDLELRCVTGCRLSLYHPPGESERI